MSQASLVQLEVGESLIEQGAPPEGFYLILDGELPAAVSHDVLAYVGCVAGAEKRESYFQKLADAGLTDLEILKDVARENGSQIIIATHSEIILDDAVETNLTLLVNGEAVDLALQPPDGPQREVVAAAPLGQAFADPREILSLVSGAH